MDLYRADDAPASSVRFKVFSKNVALPLSDVPPMLENMGLKVIDEIPHEIEIGDGETMWLHDFGMITRDESDIDVAEIKDAFEQTFDRVWCNDVEDDGFNGMVTFSGLTWRQIVVLRAYCNIRARPGYPVQRPLHGGNADAERRHRRRHRCAVRRTVRSRQTGQEIRRQPFPEKIATALDQVQNLDEDRILRRFLNLVESTLRTNFYQPDDDGNPKSYVSFKFDSSQITDLLLPRAAAGNICSIPPDGRRASARRQGRPRRHPLVGPAGRFPHRDLRPDEGPDAQECSHRPCRRQGRFCPR